MNRVLDVILSAVLAVPLATLVLLRALVVRRGRQMDRRLMVLDSAYSYRTIMLRKLEHSVVSRDLNGFFSQVWTVHPLVGASPDDPVDARGVTQVALAPSHTIVEAKIGLTHRLDRFPATNFLLVQLRLFSRLNRIIRAERIGVIRAGDPFFQGFLAFLLGAINRIPFVVRINGNYDAIYAATGQIAYPRLLKFRWLERKLGSFVLKRADLVAGANRNNLDYALANGARPDRTALFRYGNLIDPVHFGDPNKRTSVRAELSIGSRPFLVAVTRLEPVKFPDDVVAAFAAARRQVGDLALVIIGEGSMRSELDNLVSQMGLEDDVFFVGNRDQSWIARCLADASAVAAPMAGRSLVESMLSGTPVVAFDVDWHKEAIEDRVTGFLVPTRDVEAMGSLFAEIVKGQHGEMGSRGRIAALESMDPDKLVQSERESYERILASGPL